MPDQTIAWADQTAAQLVRTIYDRLALDQWSCRRIAQELNDLGVPTSYAPHQRPSVPDVAVVTNAVMSDQ